MSRHPSYYLHQNHTSIFLYIIHWELHLDDDDDDDYDDDDDDDDGDDNDGSFDSDG